MPFVPSVLEERVEKFVVDSSPSPFRIMAFDMPKCIEKDICGVIHVDNTSRPHTVERDVNMRYYDMIKSFDEITQDALKHFEWKCVDLLAMEDASFIESKNLKRG